MNIGSTGRYIDAEENEYAVQVVGRSFEVKDGKKQETGNFELVGTFRDGTTRVFANVAPDLILSDASTAAAPAKSSEAEKSPTE